MAWLAWLGLFRSLTQPIPICQQHGSRNSARLGLQETQLSPGLPTAGGCRLGDIGQRFAEGAPLMFERRHPENPDNVALFEMHLDPPTRRYLDPPSPHQTLP